MGFVRSQTWKALKTSMEYLTFKQINTFSSDRNYKNEIEKLNFENEKKLHETYLNQIGDLLDEISLSHDLKVNTSIENWDNTHEKQEPEQKDSEQKESEQKEWLVLIYAVTDSFLADTVKVDINEMETVGSTENIKVLMQLSTSKYDNVRYEIKKDSNPDFISSNVVENLGELDCGHWTTLDAFVKWGLASCKAKRVFLILQNCVGSLGYGAPESKESFKGIKLLDGMDQLKARSRENGARYMGTRHLGHALESISNELGRPIDVLGLDDSSNCTIEKFYEYRQWVDLYIASAGFLPVDNWPYDKVLSAIDIEPEINAENLGKKIVQDFEDSYEYYCNLPYGFGATLTCLRLNKTENLMSSLLSLSKKMYALTKKSSINRQEILAGRKSVLDYFGSNNLDLGEWTDALKAYSFADQELKDLCADIRKEMAGIIIAHTAKGRHYSRSTGMSITVDEWFGLWGSYDCKKYKNLKWCKYSNWIKFLLNLYKEI
jgi:hypothetical protein